MENYRNPGYTIVNTKGLHSAVIQVGFLAGSLLDENICDITPYRTPFCDFFGKCFSFIGSCF